MVPKPFLRWDSIVKNISVISWNIHGTRNKLESTLVLHFICTYDVIILNEVKSTLPITIPGFVCYRRHCNNMHRGGCVMFIKNRLVGHITKLELPHPECAILKFRFMPNLYIIGCYIPPSDSPYHSFAPLMEAQQLIENSDPNERFIILGDLNARFGKERTTFIEGKHLPEMTQYLPSPDPIPTANANARYVTSTLADSLVLLNGIRYGHTVFRSALTFRQKKTWISELDVCLATLSCLPAIDDLVIHQRTDLPSDHAPISISINVERTCSSSEDSLVQTLQRANELGHNSTEQYNTQSHAGRTHCKRRPIKMSQIDTEKAIENLSALEPPDLNQLDIHNAAERVNDALYNAALMSRAESPPSAQMRNEQAPGQNRWNNLLNNDEPRALWKAIDWNGAVEGTDAGDRPDDDEFRKHFELLLDPPNAQRDLSLYAQATNVHLPITDDPIQPREVLEATKSLKASKSGGLSGVPPGLLKLLPDSWIVFFASMFTLLLNNFVYPDSWCYTKLVVLFKKGSRKLCDNYRGISLMESAAKLYDSILNRRLTLWFKPDREQAGSQSGRGCIEHILTLRLLIDFAQKKRQKLYLIFVDFSKAYDRVPRHLLLQKLVSLGCGTLMTRSLAAIYENTQMILRTANITSTLGVRQGSPTSCFLFTLMVNDLIRNLKQGCAPDGYLQWLHTLMLMDDTILLATSRERAEEKARILKTFCTTSGMIINEGKTKFMVINGDANDRRALEIDDMKIENCQSYTYLGCIFSQDGSLRSAVKKQCESKLCHVAKFEAFVNKNPDAPFIVKKKVFDAALLSAILYGIESWLSLAAVELARPMYMQCLRIMLGVRKTTAGDLCLVEAGLPTLIQKAREIQKRTIKRLLCDRTNMLDDPFMHIFKLCQRSNTPCYKYISDVLNSEPSEENQKLLNRISTSERTKYISYRTLMNPGLTKHAMYHECDVKEHERIATTQLRLSSHNLAIEKGRWCRKPPEERLCPICNVIQDKQHALRDCRVNATQRSTLTQKIDGLDLCLPSLFTDDALAASDVTHACFTLMQPFCSNLT